MLNKVLLTYFSENADCLGQCVDNGVNWMSYKEVMFVHTVYDHILLSNVRLNTMMKKKLLASLTFRHLRIESRGGLR